MQYLPDRGKGGPLAIMILGVLLVMVYLLILDPYFSALGEAQERLEMKQTLLSRLESTAADTKQLRAKLAEVEEFQTRNNLFLPETDFNRGAAALTSTFKKMVSNQSTDGACQVVSTQNIRSKDKERFEPVIIRARLRCELEDLLPVLHEMESGTPAVMVENVNISRRVVPARRGKNTQNQRPLDVRFDLRAYVRPSSEESVQGGG